MFNEIVAGIALRLREAFGEGYEIYQDNVEQGLQEPCFFIRPLKMEQLPLLGRRALRRCPFDVQYFPARQGDNAELCDAGGRMLDALGLIELPDGSLLRGFQLGWETADGVLHFTVHYPLTIHAPQPREMMGELDAKITCKGVGSP